MKTRKMGSDEEEDNNNNNWLRKGLNLSHLYKQLKDGGRKKEGECSNKSCQDVR